MKSADVEVLINQVLAKQAMDDSALQDFITGVAQRISNQFNENGSRQYTKRNFSP